MEFMKSPPGDDPIVVEGYFAAPPAKVFAAWTDPDIVVQWFGQAPYSLMAATIDLRPGGAWQFLMSSDEAQSTSFEGAYLEIQAAERLVFSWSHVVDRGEHGRDATAESRVEVDFIPNGDGTDVRLIHSGIRNEDGRRGVGGGWEKGFGFMVAIFGGAE